MDVQTIPLREDTQCRKCHQRFFKGTSMMSSHCVTDGNNHDWYSPTLDSENELAALRAKLSVAVEALGEYSSRTSWGCTGCIDPFTVCCDPHSDDLWQGKGDKGYMIADTALTAIRGESNDK